MRSGWPAANCGMYRANAIGQDDPRPLRQAARAPDRDREQDDADAERREAGQDPEDPDLPADVVDDRHEVRVVAVDDGLPDRVQSEDLGAVIRKGQPDADPAENHAPARRALSGRVTEELADAEQCEAEQDEPGHRQ